MHVTQSESCKSQIDYRTWKQREKESVAAQWQRQAKALFAAQGGCQIF